MADDSIYNPETKPAERPQTPLSAAQQAAQPSVPVSDNLSADASIAAESGETLEEAIARIRQIRKPFGAALTQKLALPVRIGYHRHWFNDVAGRVDEAKANGWAHIKNPRDGTPLKRVVGTGRDNGVLWAYAMELPEVFWQEEMDARHAAAKAKVDAIKAKPFQAKPGQAQASDQGKFYSPIDAPLQVVKT
jgi:hypothetical protein